MVGGWAVAEVCIVEVSKNGIVYCSVNSLNHFLLGFCSFGMGRFGEVGI